jgi:catechol 2,3-dioxygenase-like lactoylglutathione lyase family enzyme
VFGKQKINLHRAASPWKPHAAIPKPGSEDLCFITDVPIDEVLQKLVASEIEVLEGGMVVSRVGAVGKLRSVYIRDPDGNLIEYVSP